MSVRKTGVCVDCVAGTKPKVLIAGRCQKHYWANLSRKNNKNRASKIHVCLPFASSKNLISWYEHHIENAIWVCENCKTPINPLSEHIRFSTQAHILPKEHFLSAKLLLINHLVLGVSECGCHQLWDRSWKDAENMPVFMAAMEKIVPILPFLPSDEVKKLPGYLKQKLTQDQ
jgi:hypothetical protein